MAMRLMKFYHLLSKKTTVQLRARGWGTTIPLDNYFLFSYIKKTNTFQMIDHMEL